MSTRMMEPQVGVPCFQSMPFNAAQKIATVQKNAMRDIVFEISEFDWDRLVGDLIDAATDKPEPEKLTVTNTPPNDDIPF